MKKSRAIRRRVSFSMMLVGAHLIERGGSLDELFSFVVSETARARRVYESLELLEQEIEAAAAWIPRIDCKHKSAAAGALLSMSGEPFEIVMGVRLDQAPTGHAWVRSRGTAIFRPRVTFEEICTWATDGDGDV